LEINAATTPWTDRHAAHHRNTRRALVDICEMIREQLVLMGFDPALAVSLQRGQQDSETLRAADAAITRRCGQSSRYRLDNAAGSRDSVF